MSRARTAIRRMWVYSDGPNTALLSYGRDPAIVANEPAVLVLPDNPAARRAMVERVVKMLWPVGTPYAHHRQMVEDVLATALIPSR